MATETETLSKTVSKTDSLMEEAPTQKGHKKSFSKGQGKSLGKSGPPAPNVEVKNIKDIGTANFEDLTIAKETLGLNWKINTSPALLEDKAALKTPLTDSAVKRIDLRFRSGLEVTARNLKGVTIKDALDAIYKQFRKTADDELDKPILRGFEWNKSELWTYLVVHLQEESASQPSKKKKKGGDE